MKTHMAKENAFILVLLAAYVLFLFIPWVAAFLGF
jgi:hypothetical protein